MIEERKGGADRFNTGKADLSLIPLATLEDEARVWEYGAKKYSAGNWLRCANWNVPLASLLRHLSAWQSGEDFDPETGLSHLGHISCNVRMLTYYAKHFPEGDNRLKSGIHNPPVKVTELKATNATDKTK